MKHSVIILTKHTTLEYETAKLLSNFIAAGIDASVRHFNNFDIVVNQTIKYIFTENNITFPELEKFVENCLKYKLNNCCFQISMNYKNSIHPCILSWYSF